MTYWYSFTTSANSFTFVGQLQAAPAVHVVPLVASQFTRVLQAALPPAPQLVSAVRTVPSEVVVQASADATDAEVHTTSDAPMLIPAAAIV